MKWLKEGREVKYSAWQQEVKYIVQCMARSEGREVRHIVQCMATREGREVMP